MSNEKHDGGKNWPGLVLVFFGAPSVAVIGQVMVGSYVIPLFIVAVFGYALLASGVSREFSRFPMLTKLLVVTFPLAVTFAFWIHHVQADYYLGLSVILGYGGLHLVSNALMKKVYPGA